MSFGSLEESRYILEFANKQKYFDDNKYKELNQILDEVARILWSIINKEEKI